MKNYIIGLMSVVLVLGCAAQSKKIITKPGNATPAVQEPPNNTPAKIGDTVPGTNGQLVYAKVQPLTDLEQSAVEGFNAKAAVLQNQMTQLQQSGQRLISELKVEHKVDGKEQWLVSPDGKSLVMVKSKTPTAPPAGVKDWKPPVNGDTAPKKKP